MLIILPPDHIFDHKFLLFSGLIVIFETKPEFLHVSVLAPMTVDDQDLWLQVGSLVERGRSERNLSDSERHLIFSQFTQHLSIHHIGAERRLIIHGFQPFTFDQDICMEID